MATTSKSDTRSWRSFRALQVCLGLLLLTAAGLKTHQLATEPVLEAGILDSRWFLIAVVEFEFFFGLWLLAGLFPIWTWRASIAFFAAFACASLYKGLAGEASCGCFGRVSVSPWLTFSLDVFLLGGLLVCRPTSECSTCNTANSCMPVFRVATLLGAMLFVGVPAGAAMVSYRPTTLSEVGEVLGDGRTVVLEPETWIGKRFPLLEWIDIDARLDQGRWLVVLHRPGCPECRELLRAFRARNMRGSTRGEVRTAFVDVKAAHSVSYVMPKGPWFFQGRLPESHTWFVQTPVQIQLVGGVVQVISRAKC